MKKETILKTQMLNDINKEVFGENSTQSISRIDFLNGFIKGVQGVSEEAYHKAAETAVNKMETIKSTMQEKGNKK